MPYKDKGKARVAARERKRRLREASRDADWVDGRGRHGNHASGSQHARWNGGRMMDRSGYVMIRVGKGHPLSDPNGYVREHVIVMCSAIGRRLGPGEVVHHRNGDRADNRLENLELMLIAEHNRAHPRPRGTDGRFTKSRAGRLLDGREHNEYPEGKS